MRHAVHSHWSQNLKSRSWWSNSPERKIKRTTADHLPPLRGIQLFRQDICQLQMSRHPVKRWSAWFFRRGLEGSTVGLKPLKTSFPHHDLTKTRQINCQSFLRRSLWDSFSMEVVEEALAISHSMNRRELSTLSLTDHSPFREGQKEAPQEKSTLQAITTSHRLSSKSRSADTLTCFAFPIHQAESSITITKDLLLCNEYQASKLGSKLMSSIPWRVLQLLNVGVDIAPGGVMEGDESDLILRDGPQADALSSMCFGHVHSLVGLLEVFSRRIVLMLLCLGNHELKVRSGLLGQPRKASDWCPVLLDLLLGDGAIRSTLGCHLVHTSISVVLLRDADTVRSALVLTADVLKLVGDPFVHRETTLLQCLLNWTSELLLSQKHNVIDVGQEQSSYLLIVLVNELKDAWVHRVLDHVKPSKGTLHLDVKDLLRQLHPPQFGTRRESKNTLDHFDDLACFQGRHPTPRLGKVELLRRELR